MARAMFYMAIRYEGGGKEHTEDLELVDSPASGTGNLGKLSTLIRWHLAVQGGLEASTTKQCRPAGWFQKTWVFASRAKAKVAQSS